MRNLFSSGVSYILTFLFAITLTGFPLNTGSLDDNLPDNRILLPENRRTWQKSSPENRKSHKPLQTHVGPAVYSFDIPDNHLVDFYRKRYSSEEWLNWLDSVFTRAKVYRDHIVSRIEYFNLPPELLFLPVIESAFRVNAISRSGAVGLWQFMENSIEPYNLRINEWLDERKDFWKATDASLQKLKYNFSQLGDWFLALAAYNCGLNKVKSVIEQTGIRNYWVLSERGLLPIETIHYVPKFLAVVEILMYPGRNGISISWEKSIKWKRVELDQAVDLRVLSEESGLTMDILRKGNAELHYGITPPPSSGYMLKIPEQHYEQVLHTLKQKKEKLMRFYIHTIQSGDTFYALAEHYGIPVALIQKYNPRVNPKALRVGMEIVIPAYRQVEPYRREILKKAAFTGTYTVKRGDTLWAIARRFATTPEEIARENGLSVNGIILDGMRLKVPETNALGIEGQLRR